LHGAFPPFTNNKELSTIDLGSNDLHGFVTDFTGYGNVYYINASFNDLEGCYGDYERFDPNTFFTANSYIGNTRMPYFGNLNEWLLDSTQINAPCAIPGYDQYRAVINDDCECVMTKCTGSHPDLPALLEIYESTGGENWLNNEGWEAAAQGYRCDPCSEKFGAFYGVTCENGRVVCIDFDGVESCDFNGFGGNNLRGAWPKVGLARLETLILDDNYLTGDIPDISNMPMLRELRVSHNQLTSEIPIFDRNPHLTTVRLSYNNLVGIIPDQKIADSISFLTLSNNNLSGCFSDWMCDLQLCDLKNNNAMPWNGDFEIYCGGEPQESAPCTNGLSNPGKIKDCFCCETPEDPQQEHVCVQTIYPNPAQSDLYISNLEEGKEVLVHNIKGQLVIQERLFQNKLDVTALSSGVHFISYKNLDSEYVTYKFIKL